MREHSTTYENTKLEQELMSILLSNSLYEDMSRTEKEKLLNYLVTSYFEPLSGKKSRALPKSI
jgi:uncharacterized protein YaaW (UPF0174 family)